MKRINPSAPERPHSPTSDKPPERSGDLRHIVDTGLPPGIDIEEAKDPGSQTPHVPVDDRS
jgi:hypothetical protein